jgi:hypothetical protein
MKKRKLPELTKLPYLWKAAAAGLAGLLTTAVHEAIKQLGFANLTPRQSHTRTILYCAALVFVLSALFLRREETTAHLFRDETASCRTLGS